jgi:prepilin-type N-terminal cleavage/methylation domain-containing protein
MKFKSGFGLMEVLVASVVLAFLLVGLNIMQKGNRESVLRIRARDGANIVAQNVIDSISALGPASVGLGVRGCENNHADLCREHEFAGMVGSKVLYSVTVEVKEADRLQEETEFMEQIKSTNDNFNSINADHIVAKQVDVTVKWNFKSSEQSINVSSIVR